MRVVRIAFLRAATHKDRETVRGCLGKGAELLP